MPLKTTPWSTAAPSTLPVGASFVVAFGGSSSSKRAQIASKIRVDSRPAMMPKMIPKGL